MNASFWDRTNRLAGLRRFAVAITVLNIAGHFVLGFEASWAYPLVALATAYSMEILLELVDARLNHRPSRFSGGIRQRVDFLLSAHISGLACSMLLYANERLWPIAFAAAVAMASKAVIRMNINGGERHILNPSNFGITVTLLLFTWVGVSQPYQFTENLNHIGDWIFPVILISLGSFLNTNFTKRMPLIFAWLGGFLLQGLIRSIAFDLPLIPTWTSVTGVAFLLFTFYMVTDPATTPSSRRGQIIFGASVAAVYGLLVTFQVVFGLFFALTIVCIGRGVAIATADAYSRYMASRSVREESVMLIGEEA